MITNEQFNNALKKLCIQESYYSEQYPSSVEKILFPKHSLTNEAKTLLKYFYKVEGDIKEILYLPLSDDEFSKALSNNINLFNKAITPWKLQDYVKFIRTKRDEMFPNNYKKKSRKFISHYKRSILLSQYEKDLYAR